MLEINVPVGGDIRYRYMGDVEGLFVCFLMTRNCDSSSLSVVVGRLLTQRSGSFYLWDILVSSVAGPGCLSRILIFTHPGSRIPDPDPKTARKEKGEKNFFCQTFLCSHKFHKIENYFSFEVLKKKILGQFSKNSRTFYPKNCH